MSTVPPGEWSGCTSRIPTKSISIAITSVGCRLLVLKSAAGDSVVLQAPDGREYLDVLEACYERISMEPFREPPGSSQPDITVTADNVGHQAVNTFSHFDGLLTTPLRDFVHPCG